MDAQRDDSRTVLAVTGADRAAFLKGLVTNDPRPGALVYAALLTPQGKFLHDFFLLERDGDILIDVTADAARPLGQRLTLYKLRADVAIGTLDLAVLRGLGDPPPGAHPDPRDPAMGWRAYVPTAEAPAAGPPIDWDAIRVAHAIPEAGHELTPDAYILEWDFERLAGVDHRKGCYVGQEVTARMKHKTTLRKGLAQVAVEGPAAPGTPITDAEGRAAGTLHTRAGDRALAYLRFDRADGPLHAGEATVTRL